MTPEEKVWRETERQRQQLKDQANDYQMFQQIITEVHQFNMQSYEAMMDELVQIQKEYAGTPYQAVVQQISHHVAHIFARYSLKMHEVIYHQLIMNLNREETPRTPAQPGQAQPSFFDQIFEQGGEP